MPELRTGFDYHLAEARPSHLTDVVSGETIRTWVAVCDACGWVGFDRSFKATAEEDAYQHDVTENPA